MPCKLVILLSGSGSNLQAFIDASRDGLLPSVEICAVISNKAQAFGLERAKQAGIATACIDHTQFASREAFDAELQVCIDSYDADLVVLAGFMRILTPGFVRHYLGRLINIHPSLLPKYPGLHTHQRALDAGDREAGATVHFVTEELDGGPAIIQAKIPVFPGDDAAALATRVLSKEHTIYPLAARWFAEGRLVLQDSKAVFDEQVLPETGILFQQE
ncbi:phosphoribosylglycinamide formyltransferase [gamma proteobacterium BDW918]|uniref:Phosphoribosylglycinamide formyltransferase n=1 Tax=Zhongshania aliphaticivorans TaxID=1470434 RepID=A0A127M3A9_9GAMM|nr:phosphoribosylglycinamide formyltransferase [Zhongshania aliphaticivorans]AMO67716.1 phosphoribosylglycinamide formyltransferase [Zhongshania aliphaticivorans]EIF44847.1 phosphoribosylglycinamide formyltransferase [gamma proteobacterium BDW918]|tara:strand:- start:1987 stop:2637 length:651 start_codon:yes stop_codon:yes gene_type:complete